MEGHVGGAKRGARGPTFDNQNEPLQPGVGRPEISGSVAQIFTRPMI